MKKFLYFITFTGLISVSTAQQSTRPRGDSMGGAPNIGAGMGTGTGAGSTVGPETGRGASSSGAMGAEKEEMYEKTQKVEKQPFETPVKKTKKR